MLFSTYKSKCMCCKSVHIHTHTYIHTHMHTHTNIYLERAKAIDLKYFNLSPEDG